VLEKKNGDEENESFNERAAIQAFQNKNKLQIQPKVKEEIQRIFLY